LVAGLFFLRFWRDTRDRLFLGFAISFLIEGLNRATLGLSGDPNKEGRFLFCAVSLLSADSHRHRTEELDQSGTTPVLSRQTASDREGYRPLR
jgi:hypothetical protein